MSWSINASGTKRVAKKMAAEQADNLVNSMFMTEAQATMVQAVIDACPGPIVSVTCGGHNSGSGTMADGVAGGGFSVSASSSAA
jgi:Ni,Fe-hydrogenase III small subunit